MLNPDVRHLLTDGLRPPTGWHLDAAVATTYTLDINSLLLAPLSMAAYDRAEEGIENAAPHELLEAIRRYAERTTVFCQAGGIHVPSTYRKLTVFAEDSIVEVVPPPGRVFHPKIWVLRFTNAADEYMHRLLCLSRNLTGDRSWDTLLRADEDASAPGQMPAHAASEFLEHLLTRSTRDVPSERADLVRSVAASLRGRGLAVPSPFTDGALLPLGVQNGVGWTVPSTADACVVISPFLDVTTVRRLPEGTTIVSRPDAFDRIGSAELAGHDLRVLQPHADAPPDEMETDTGDTSGERPLEVKTGLHAKVISWDVGGTSTLLTGSANATTAAFGGNIEFDVLLSGPASRCGAAAILRDSEKETGFVRLLQPYTPSGDPASDEAYALEREIEEYHVLLASSAPRLEVSSTDTGHLVRLAWTRPPPALGETWVRPITLKGAHDRELGISNEWPGLGYADLTPYVAIRTRLQRDGTTVEQSCAIRADLEGAPDNRARRVLRELLSRVDDVLRYLALLLKDPGIDDVAGALLDATNDENADDDSTWKVHNWQEDLIILEPLVRAFARNDGSLDRVERLLQDLRDDDGRMPDLGRDFETLWEVVSKARRSR